MWLLEVCNPHQVGLMDEDIGYVGVWGGDGWSIVVVCVCDHVVVYRRGCGAVLLRFLLAWAIREEGGCVFCV